MDKLAEAYAGTRDMLNGFIWYDSLGNGKSLRDSPVLKNISNVINQTNVVLATPFALSVLLPPEVWNTISVGINAGR